MVTQKLSPIILFSLLPVAIWSIVPYLGRITESIPLISNTTIWWIIQFVILFTFIKSKNYYFDAENNPAIHVVQWYLLWNLISIIRGLFIAETYWDWKALVANSIALLLPIIAYTATNKDVIKAMLNRYIKYALPLFLIFIFFIEPGAYGFYLVPISFLVLFLPVISRKWKLVILSLSIIVITIDLGVRSNVIKFGLPILLSLIYYFRFIRSNLHYEFIRRLLFIIPLIFFGLAVMEIFNVFNMNEYVKKDYTKIKKDAYGEEVEENLTEDTRTFLYTDVLETAKKYNSWLIGRSPARGNESEMFGEFDLSGRGERVANEVAVLNIFTWTGVIGVFLYFLVFYKASFLAINHSRNTFIKVVGLFIAFRWLYAWVEDVNDFSLTTFILWIMIGLCYSNSFRKMNNEEVMIWIKDIFTMTETLPQKVFAKRITVIPTKENK